MKYTVMGIILFVVSVLAMSYNLGEMNKEWYSFAFFIFTITGIFASIIMFCKGAIK